MIYKINLQLFAESDKTEKPTPKKRREAREEGQVLQSKELTSVILLFSSFVGLKIFGSFIYHQIEKFTVEIFNETSNYDIFLHENNLMINFLKILWIFIVTTAPMLLIAFISALLINYTQVGFLFTTKTLKIKLNRLNPIEGFKKIFSKRALIELIKSVLKVVLVGFIAYKFIYNNIGGVIQYPEMDIINSFSNFSNLTFKFVIRVLSVLLLLSILDYGYQWWDHEKNLMMTKQEIKEEYKQTEGDPFIKGKIKERQRRMAMSRMMQDVPKADVIITNPTHYAVAIKYDRDIFEAPLVIAKGVDVIAENIKKIAKENSIPLVENKPLARTLYDTVEIGEIISEDLYEAVAEVLAYVYSLKSNL